MGSPGPAAPQGRATMQTLTNGGALLRRGDVDGAPRPVSEPRGTPGGLADGHGRVNRVRALGRSGCPVCAWPDVTHTAKNLNGLSALPAHPGRRCLYRPVARE